MGVEGRVGREMLKEGGGSGQWVGETNGEEERDI